MKKTLLQKVREQLEKTHKVKECCQCGLHQYIPKVSEVWKCRRCGKINQKSINHDETQ